MRSLLLTPTFVFCLSLTGLARQPTAPTQLAGRPAQQLPGSPQQPLRLDPAVRTGKLPNGLTYFIRRNTEPANRVILYLVNKAGSILESEDQRGLAHFMEHMSFNGTRHFPKNALIDYLQKSGVRFGADINAYTSFDETVYQLPLPSDKPDLLKNGIQIVRDWAAEATLDPSEIDKERGVVLEEKRLGKGAGERMSRIYFPSLLNHSRYAERIPIGLDSVLNHFTPATIHRFYHDWYRPDLQAVIIVGDIDVNQMEQSIKEKFSDLKNPLNERPRTKYTIPLTGKNQFIAVTDKEMTATSLQILIKHKGLSFKTAAEFRENIIRDLFNQLLSERYAELARNTDPPFIQGGAGIQGFMGGLDAYSAQMTARPGELEKGAKALWRETERARRFGFTPSELERAKTNYRSAVEAAYKEKDKTQSEAYVKDYQAYFLNGTAAPGIEEAFGLTVKYLPEITLAEVNAQATRYVTTTNRDILLLAPEKDKASLPDEKTITQWLREVETEAITPYKDEVNRLSFLIHPPTGGKVIQEQQDSTLQLTTLTLSNGLKVVLKPTAFKNGEILFSAFAPGGTSVYPDSIYQSAADATNIIVAGGAGNYNATEQGKYLTGKQIGLQLYIGEREQGVSGSATPKDLEAALELIYAYFTEPRKDTSIFHGIIQRSKASLTGRGDDPGNVFSDTVSAILGNYNLRRTGPSLSKLEQINLDMAYRIYRERFSDASAFTFTMVGSFDVQTIRPLLEKYLGSLPSTHAGEQAKDLGIHIPSGRIKKVVYKGTEPKATVYLVYSGPFEYNLEDRIKLDALKEALLIRLTQRLREEESGVYTPGVNASQSKFPTPRYSLAINFGCAPENVDRLKAAVQDEIDKIRKAGPPQENIDKWKAEEITQLETQLKTNNWWLGYLTGQLQTGEDLHLLSSYHSAIDNINPESLKQMAIRYLSGENFIDLELLPESKK